MRMRRGYVYFIRQLGKPAVKIGMTKRYPTQRLKDLQGSTPDKLILAGVIESDIPRQLERSLHEKFSQYRLSGEWFALTDEQVQSCLQHHDVTDNPNWIEMTLDEGGIFHYHITTGQLYVDLRTIAQMGLPYLVSVLMTDRMIGTTDGCRAVEYELLIEDFPDDRKELETQKERLIKAANRSQQQFEPGQGAIDIEL